MQGIYWMICNELDAEDVEQKSKEKKLKGLDEVWKGKQICMRQMHEHRETQENFI